MVSSLCDDGTKMFEHTYRLIFTEITKRNSLQTDHLEFTLIVNKYVIKSFVSFSQSHESL